MNAAIDIAVAGKPSVSTGVKREITGGMKEIQKSAQCSEDAAPPLICPICCVLPPCERKAGLPANMTGLKSQQCLSVFGLSQQCQPSSGTEMPHPGQQLRVLAGRDTLSGVPAFHLNTIKFNLRK